MPSPYFDPELDTIDCFMREAAGRIPPGAVLLDAGAGDSPYRPYFAHTRYIAADFAATDYHRFQTLGLACDLARLPLGANSFDAIVCTQVLEHVPEPGQVIQEFFTALKPGGQLFLTVPQSWELHEEPYDFFRYTRYGLAYLLQRAGFEAFDIRPRGGYFYLLAERIRYVPRYLPGLPPLARKAANVALIRLVAPAIGALDDFDTVKRETLGYSVIAIKPVGLAHSAAAESEVFPYGDTHGLD